MAPSKASNKAITQQQTAAAIGSQASPTKVRKAPTVRVTSPATTKRPRKIADAEATTIVPAPTFTLAEDDTTAAEEEGANPLVIIPYTRDTTPFPTAQGSSSVTDASADDVILNDKKRKLLDVEEANDEVEDDNHKDANDGDDGHEKEEATTITTPSKSEVVVLRTSSRGRPIGSGKKGFCSTQLIISVHETFSISSNVLSLSV
jgi:hypothetical protein